MYYVSIFTDHKGKTFFIIELVPEKWGGTLGDLIDLASKIKSKVNELKKSIKGIKPRGKEATILHGEHAKFSTYGLTHGQVKGKLWLARAYDTTLLKQEIEALIKQRQDIKLKVVE